ncbi:hypothetical protein PRSY57_1321600 [Plasmodium reichenowi]|uniref:Uncharacterized protein n=1 Tax=Plasmodium reichenowi TaxID=5854 RepID=A0A151L6V3_PLARE|nr:hypothetical protein PRSY57_1321600 [Plasmodium reichenowi]KYN94669.1 hypothetical protein PRSY57_1321600 [Plasmodium reichenowi]
MDKYTNNCNVNENIIPFCNYISEITEKCDCNEEKNMYLYGTYNGCTKKSSIEKNTIVDACNIYERLYCGSRFFELIILTNEKRCMEKITCNDEKTDIFCLFEGEKIYEICSILQEIAVFLNKDKKKEKIILSFIEYNNIDEVNTYNVHILDIYIYLYLRNYLKHTCSTEDENYNILYFYNEKERILNMEKYNYDINHFDIRNWLFNNMSFFLPSKRIDDKFDDHNNNKSDDHNNNNNNNNNNLLTVNKYLNVQNTSKNLSQPHNLSLFRLNSMVDNQTTKLSSKICINKELPNILINKNDNNNNYVCNKENYTSSIINSSTNVERENSVCHYLKCCTHENGNIFTLHQKQIYDNNFNIYKKFIGHNNIPLIQYIIDIPKELILDNSPFIFTNKKLEYLDTNILNDECAANIPHNQLSSYNFYYVIKIQDEKKEKLITDKVIQNIDNNLTYIHKLLKQNYNHNIISIVTQNFHVTYVFTVLKFNLQKKKKKL